MELLSPALEFGNKSQLNPQVQNWKNTGLFWIGKQPVFGCKIGKIKSLNRDDCFRPTFKLFLFPLTGPCFTGMGRSVRFFLTFQIGYTINLVVYSKTCLKGNFGYCPRASFLRRETGKVIWVPSFEHFQIRIKTGFRYVYVWWIFPHFVDKIK